MARLLLLRQSEIASERPGVFDCLREGTSRLLSLSSKQMTRLLPVWKLFFPTIAYGLLHYIISSLAQYTVLVSVRADMAERKVCLAICLFVILIYNNKKFNQIIKYIFKTNYKIYF